MATIDQSVTVLASPEKIFHALTSADELVRWFPTRASSDPRPGGKLDLAWEFNAAEQNGSQKTAYDAIEPNKRLEYKWAAGAANLATTVTFTLTHSNGGTTVRMIHTGFPEGAEGEPLVEMHAGPWSFYLMNLKSYLETGADGRAQALGQKTV